MTNPADKEPTISLVAASYELTCSCGYWEGDFQLSDFDRPNSDADEYGAWAWNCPTCKHRHIFDGASITEPY